jgi:uncharacterized protein (DUF2235 family)
MKKRLIICADGTWDEPEQTDQGMPSPTNVVKLAAAVLPFDKQGLPQIVCYHAGVGERGGIWDHLTGGAFGEGISRNIRDLYLFLVLNYSPGDEVFLFGFSRGAYTVRSLAGLIRNCGILKNEFITQYYEAYELYRDRSDASHPKAERSLTFKAQYAWPAFNIKFIGVWDTVGFLGIPFPFQVGKKKWEFHDIDLSSHVDFAYQALAIDERRKPFKPCLWQKQLSSPVKQVLEQAWFPGVHCNVGGGYEEAGLSNCALDWMWNRAVMGGLELDDKQRVLPKPDGIIHNSMTWYYHLLGARTRELGAMLPLSHELVSQAALDRKKLMGSYQPDNLNEFLTKNPNRISR